MSDNVKVFVRVWPPVPTELKREQNQKWRVDNNTLHQVDMNGTDCGPSFTFEECYGKDATVTNLYQDVAIPILEAAIAGINGAIFAYGETSSGKTSTMRGTKDLPRIIQFAVLNLFQIIKQISNRDFLIRISYVEIYNNKLVDLLDITKTVKVCETQQGLQIDATKKLTTSPEDALNILRMANYKRLMANKETRAINNNKDSSRYHSIVQIMLESRERTKEGGESVRSVNVSQLNLVVLAGSGSKWSGQTGATGVRFEEGTHINESLTVLALVAKRLSDKQLKACVGANYRVSRLTRLFQNSLGGNAKTNIICTVSPAAIEETVSSLQIRPDSAPLQGAISPASVPMEPKVVEPTIQLDSSRKSPYILRKIAKQAKNNINDFKKCTVKNICKPHVSKLIQNLETKMLRIAELEENLKKLSNTSKEIDQEMDNMKTNISSANKRIALITNAKAELRKYNRRLNLLDLDAKTREGELLSLLQEQENRTAREETNSADLHSVVVDTISYNAEVEKIKKSMKSIEELRYKNQVLETSMSMMQKGLIKPNGNDKKKLEASTAESSCQKHLHDIRDEYMEFDGECDGECEIYAKYMRKRDERSQKFKEAKARIEAKMAEYVANNRSQNKRRRIPDQDQPDCLPSCTTETRDEPTNNHEKNHKFKKINAKLINIHKKRGNSHGRENEEPANNLS